MLLKIKFAIFHSFTDAVGNAAFAERRAKWAFAGSMAMLVANEASVVNVCTVVPGSIGGFKLPGGTMWLASTEDSGVGGAVKTVKRIFCFAAILLRAVVNSPVVLTAPLIRGEPRASCAVGPGNALDERKSRA